MVLHRINLNLLECKFEKMIDDFLGKAVLILTYWNVNKDVENLESIISTVLILTYWNVNTGTTYDLQDSGAY